MRVQKNQFFFGLELTRAGETVPDIEKCDRLASFYGIKLDALMHYDEKVGNTKMAPPPEGKFLWGTIKLGNRGQIVIPKEARDKYGLQEGSRLVVLGNEEGIALIQAEKFESQLKMLMCDKVTHKKLIDSNLLFRKISRNLLSKMIQYNSKKIFF